MQSYLNEEFSLEQVEMRRHIIALCRIGIVRAVCFYARGLTLVKISLLNVLLAGA